MNNFFGVRGKNFRLAHETRWSDISRRRFLWLMEKLSCNLTKLINQRRNKIVAAGGIYSEGARHFRAANLVIDT